VEHVVGELNLSRNTQYSYRDTLRLLLPLFSKNIGRPIETLEVQDLTQKQIHFFLQHVERERHCTVRTRNQRLTAVHSLARFISARCPEHVEWAAEVVAIRMKKTGKPLIPYLEKPEMDALLSVADPSSQQAARDHAVLLFLYNSGARADEAARLKVGDLYLGPQPAVKIEGKGRKVRQCPLWKRTVVEIAALVQGREASEPVFRNARSGPFTRFGIYSLVRRCAKTAARTMPSISTKRVSPHTIRHTTATHLLRAGVDINTIRAWLGHVSLDSTNVYAEVDLEIKERALARCQPVQEERRKMWHEEQGLLSFLTSLRPLVNPNYVAAVPRKPKRKAESSGCGHIFSTAT